MYVTQFGWKFNILNRITNGIDNILHMTITGELTSVFNLSSGYNLVNIDIILLIDVNI